MAGAGATAGPGTEEQTGPQTPIVAVRDLAVHFRLSRRRGGATVRAVDGVDLDVMPGTTVGIVGESGSGKTTLARTILGLIEPTSGEVVHRRDGHARGKRHGVQAVFQDPSASLNPRMRVSDLVAEPLAANHIGTRATRGERVRQLLHDVGLPAATAQRYPHQLSGGQRQRVAIARSLALDPELIVLDEPVSSLDVSIAAQIMNLLADLQRDRGLAYLLIAHDFGVVQYLADEIKVMYLGRFLETGPTIDVFEAARRGQAHPYTEALLAASADASGHRAPQMILGDEVPSSTAPPGGCAFHTRCPRAIDQTCEHVVPAWVEQGPNRWLGCHLYDPHYTAVAGRSRDESTAGAPADREDLSDGVARTAATRPVLLELRDLTTEVSMRGTSGRAVDGVSLELRAGEALGLVGESGSGKSLTARSILRVLPRGVDIVAGSVLYEGEDLAAMPDEEVRRRFRGNRIAMIPQDPLGALNPVKTIGTLIESVLEQHRDLAPADRRELAKDLLAHVRIPDAESRLRSYPHQLSGGQRQRVVSAMALGGQPGLLIADEPTTSLDPTIQAHFLQLLRTLQEEDGLAVLLITHDLGIVAHMCDRVAVMYAGRIVEQGPVESILRSPAHPYTQGLIASIPRVDSARRRLQAIPGQPPSIFHRSEGCSFAPRCPQVHERCLAEYPPDFAAHGEVHSAACWLLEETGDDRLAAPDPRLQAKDPS